MTRADSGSDVYMLARWGDRMTRDPFYTAGMRALLYEDRSHFEVQTPGPRDVEERWWARPPGSVVSHDLSLTGAPLMLLEVAKALAAADMMVVVASPKRGPLASELVSARLPLIIDEKLLDEPARADRTLLQFDLVVAGTVHGWR